MYGDTYLYILVGIILPYLSPKREQCNSEILATGTNYIWARGSHDGTYELSALKPWKQDRTLPNWSACEREDEREGERERDHTITWHITNSLSPWVGCHSVCQRTIPCVDRNAILFMIWTKEWNPSTVNTSQDSYYQDIQIEGSHKEEGREEREREIPERKARIILDLGNILIKEKRSQK